MLAGKDVFLSPQLNMSCSAADGNTSTQNIPSHSSKMRASTSISGVSGDMVSVFTFEPQFSSGLIQNPQPVFSQSSDNALDSDYNTVPSTHGSRNDVISPHVGAGHSHTLRVLSTSKHSNFKDTKVIRNYRTIANPSSASQGRFQEKARRSGTVAQALDSSDDASMYQYCTTKR